MFSVYAFVILLIELLLQRKLEKEFALYGGVLPTTDPEPDDEVDENEEDREQVESVAGKSL